LLEEAEPELGAGENPVFAWFYIRRCVRDRLEVLRGHSASISGLGCSPDGRTLASGDGEGGIRLWDIETGRCLRVLSGASTGAKQLIFSPNGKFLATASLDRTAISIWDLSTGRRIASLDDHGPGFALRKIAFAPDHTRLIARCILPQQRLTVTNAWDISPDGAVPVDGAECDATISAEHAVGNLQRVADLLDGDEKPALLSRPGVSPTGPHELGRGRLVATRDFALTVTEQSDGSFAVYRTNTQLLIAAGRIGAAGTALALLDPVSI
jgi:hypothetical protein